MELKTVVKYYNTLGEYGIMIEDNIIVISHSPDDREGKVIDPTE